MHPKNFFITHYHLGMNILDLQKFIMKQWAVFTAELSGPLHCATYWKLPWVDPLEDTLPFRLSIVFQPRPRLTERSHVQWQPHKITRSEKYSIAHMSAAGNPCRRNGFVVDGTGITETSWTVVMMRVQLLWVMHNKRWMGLVGRFSSSSSFCDSRDRIGRNIGPLVHAPRIFREGGGCVCCLPSGSRRTIVLFNQCNDMHGDKCKVEWV